MELALKQRLIGAGVIIALAVIFIPMFLKGTGRPDIKQIPPPPQPVTPLQADLNIDQTIPLPPEMSERTDATSSVTAREATDMTAESRLAAEEKGIAEIKQERADIREEAPPPATQAKVAENLRSWVVQIASFAAQEKAAAFRDKLRKQGYKAFVEDSVAKNNTKIYRVRVGPVLERKEAEELLVKLEKNTKLKGFITKHP